MKKTVLFGLILIMLPVLLLAQNLDTPLEAGVELDRFTLSESQRLSCSESKLYFSLMAPRGPVPEKELGVSVPLFVHRY